MARTINQIYKEAVDNRGKYLGLSELRNSSRMSVLDAITWVVSSCIWTFENLLDVFKVDMARDYQKRIAGTPAYYVDSLLRYQHGDTLSTKDGGLTYSYADTDVSKRVIKKVAWASYVREGYLDEEFVLKVAAESPDGSLRMLDAAELAGARGFLQQITFAGCHTKLVSLPGDVLIPKVSVYYDGSVSEDEIYAAVEQSLNDFCRNTDFHGTVYLQNIVDAIQATPHVKDVAWNTSAADEGFFVAMYDDDHRLIPVEQSIPPLAGGAMPFSIYGISQDTLTRNYEKRLGRVFKPNSGFMKQSTGEGVEKKLPLWRDTLKFIVETSW